jgi:hypothetical protein
MDAKLTMHHEEAPGINSPMDEVGMTEHVNEMGVLSRGWRHSKIGVQRNDESIRRTMRRVIYNVRMMNESFIE